MKFAAIVPEDGLAILDAAKHSYHMVLGHHIVDSPELRKFYKERSARGDFIIVDNGIAESADVPFVDVVRAANEIGASEIVLPDIIGDPEGSLSATLNPAHYTLVEPTRRVVVPQAATHREFEYAMRRLEKLPYATIALNRGPEKECGKRLWKLFELSQMGLLDTYHIHLLGVSQNPKLDLDRLRTVLPSIRSVDTAAPFAYAQDAISLETVDKDTAHTSMSWTWVMSGEEQRLSLDNFFTFRRWCSGENY